MRLWNFGLRLEEARQVLHVTALLLACLWLWYHLKPTPLVQLITPHTTTTKVVNGLPDIDGMRAVKP